MTDSPEQARRRQPVRRRVRSYVLREGRLTAGQRRALDELWTVYGLPADGGPLDFDAVFGRRAGRILEIGFGDGETLAELARRHPDKDFLGIEVHRPGVGRLLRRARELELANLRVMRADAVEILEERIPPASLDRINVFFPDPWPKKRHHKRRLIQPAFVSLAASRLAPGGVLHVCTDWEDYAEHMLAVLSAEPLLANVSPAGGYVPRPPERPETKFEQRGQRRGHGVQDLVYVRRGSEAS